MAAKNLGASGVLYTDRRDFYIDPQVVKELWTDVAPFTTVISNKETRQVNDPLFKMFEHRNPWVKQEFSNAGDTQTLAVAGTESAVIAIDGIVGFGATPVVDTHMEGLICEIWNEAKTLKKANVLITDGTSSDTQILVKVLTTVSGSDYTLVDNDVFIVIGNAHGEGENAPDAWSDELQVVFNSCQIFKTPLEITGTLLQAALRGESSELARLREMKNQEHKMQKEKAFLFGTRVGGTDLGAAQGDTFADGGRTGALGGLVRTTYGILSAIEEYGASSGDDQSQFTVSEASYGYSNFVDDMEKIFQYVPTSGVKRAFCGAGALGYWSKIAGSSGMAGNSGWTVNMSDMKRDTLGFNYKVLETPHGILQLIPTPALRGPHNKQMLIVDEDNLFHAQYRSPMFQANIKSDNGYDGVKDQYFSDEGVGVSLIESHNLMSITA